MTLQRARRLGGLPLGRLCRSLLLPLVLLFAQHGALLHELAHLGAPDAQDERDPQQSHTGACDQCLAFSDLDPAFTSGAVAVPPSASGFAVPAASRLLAWSADAPPQQSRGPPAFI